MRLVPTASLGMGRDVWDSGSTKGCVGCGGVRTGLKADGCAVLTRHWADEFFLRLLYFFSLQNASNCWTSKELLTSLWPKPQAAFGAFCTPATQAHLPYRTLQQCRSILPQRRGVSPSAGDINKRWIWRHIYLATQEMYVEVFPSLSHFFMSLKS